MRVAAPLTAFLLVAGCSSSPPPAPAALQTAPSAAPTIIPTPPPSPQTELVPTIDYPDAPNASETAGTAASGGASSGDGSSGGSTATGSPAPSASPSEAPGPEAPTAMTVQLDHMPMTLQGFTARVSSSDPNVVLFQAGPNDDALTNEAPGSLRVGFRFATTRVADKPVAVEAATVRYTQLTNGSRSSWLANYKPGDAGSTLMLESSVSEGRMTFSIKGTLAPDGGYSFGGFGGFGGPGATAAGNMFIDWRVTAAGLPTPSTASPSPTPTPFSFF